MHLKDEDIIAEAEAVVVDVVLCPLQELLPFDEVMHVDAPRRPVRVDHPVNIAQLDEAAERRHPRAVEDANLAHGGGLLAGVVGPGKVEANADAEAAGVGVVGGLPVDAADAELAGLDGGAVDHPVHELIAVDLEEVGPGHRPRVDGRGGEGVHGALVGAAQGRKHQLGGGGAAHGDRRWLRIW